MLVRLEHSEIFVLDEVKSSHGTILRGGQNCISLLRHEFDISDAALMVIKSGEAQTVLGSPALDLAVVATSGEVDTIR